MKFLLFSVHYLYNYYMVYALLSHTYHVTYYVILIGIKGFDHETKVKARLERQNLQTTSQLCTKQVGTGDNPFFLSNHHHD